MSLDIIEKLSKRTPKWAIGVVTILVTIGATFVTIYSTSKEEIVKSFALSESKHHHDIEERDRMLSAILELVNSNRNQINELSSILYRTQEQNSSLQERVAALEKEVLKVTTELRRCEIDLSKCKGIKHG